MKIAIFYHISPMGIFWKDVHKEIKNTIIKSGLVDIADVYIQNICENIEDYEFPTLEKLYKFAKEHNNYAILYIHTKGVSHSCNKKSIADWRSCMLYWLVEQYQICLEKIAKGYDVIGVKYMEHPVSHFQGNFWWSTSKHVKKLCVPRLAPLPTYYLFTERHRAEFWILSEKCKHYEIYDYKIDPYSQEHPRKLYAK
jgi:hypothetical protein